ncbi:MAG: M23 family metallopeptidase [Lachnospiraceae bacterium]|nr:M23 family metallopeptidase [Lachnospiraceae bacterium]
MTAYNKKIEFTFIKYAFLTMFLCLLFIKSFTGFESSGNNYFHVFVGDTAVGTLGSLQEAEELFVVARRNVSSGTDEMVLSSATLRADGEEVLWGTVDDPKTVVAAMEEAIKNSVIETRHHSFIVKINEYMVNLKSLDEVEKLFQTAIDNYDVDSLYDVELVPDRDRAFNVLTASVIPKDGNNDRLKTPRDYSMAGVEVLLSQMGKPTITNEYMDFDDFELGLMQMGFTEDVEIVGAYLPDSQLTDLGVAIDDITKEQETASEYEVVAGDTLSEISIKVNIPVDTIVEMNDSLDDANTSIHIGDKLIITVPEPELSVERTERGYFEEVYDADIIYVDNDNWYTTQTKVLQQPSAGFRKIVADVKYVNAKEVGREILKEEVVVDAVPKIVERGTKIPPTYIKPISGGVLTSGFGRRKAPTRGASTYHKGVDWSTPKGTPVYASCGGVVAKAGWGSGYGYVVYINHEDGRQTRYGHLSKVLVSAGQSVKQGERIALSGNTGVSTGPHLHFEILINGSQVNPLNYLN